MRKILMLGAGVVTLGVGVASCANLPNPLGCFNPTGYCGASSTPDPDRIGGPSWFLWDATAQDRLAYYSDRCAQNDDLTSARDIMSCAESGIRQNAHQYCVLYYLPPIRPKDDAEKAARNGRYESCKQGVLDQHGL